MIFRRYQQRSRERMAYAIELLNKKPDFDIDESFNFDREKEPWPANAAEMNELWRKRVKNDALSLVTAGKQWPEAVDMLRKRYEHVEKRMDQSKPEDVFEAFMNAFVLSLDPHSNYFSARNSEEYNIQMSLSYEGIGASLQLDRRLRHRDRCDRRRPGGGQRKTCRQRPHHRGGRRKNRRADRCDRLAAGRRGAEDPRPGRHDGAAADLCRPARLRARPQKVVDFTRNRISLEAQASHKAMRTVVRNGKRDQGRHHHGTELLSGLRCQPRRREGLPQHHARRAAADRRVAQGRRRCADHGFARERRRLPARGRIARRPVHRPRAGGAVARHHRAHRGR